MATFTSWSALENAIRKDFTAAMNECESLSYSDAVQNTMYYRQNYPEVYEVTWQLEKSARSTGVNGGGNSLSFEVYADRGFSYNTGTWDTEKVFDVAEAGGLLNPGHFWEKTEQDIQKNIDIAFGKRFSR